MKDSCRVSERSLSHRNFGYRPKTISEWLNHYNLFRNTRKWKKCPSVFFDVSGDVLIWNEVHESSRKREEEWRTKPEFEINKLDCKWVEP